jgi:hypothetical protein
VAYTKTAENGSSTRVKQQKTKRFGKPTTKIHSTIPSAPTAMHQIHFNIEFFNEIGREKP